MPKSITTQTKQSAEAVPMAHIILAEADVGEVAKIKSQIDPCLHTDIQVVHSYAQLLDRLSIESPLLILLSRIDNSNYFELCKNCRQYRSDLPIFLLSKTGIISDSFRNLVKISGINDVIAQTVVDLEQLLKTYLNHLPIYPLESANLSKLTGKKVADALIEMIGFCSNYFGALAQGNYWCKTLEASIEEHPFLAYWSADRFGNIVSDDRIHNKILSDREIADIRFWIRAFIDECERSVINFQAILDRADLSVDAKYLLNRSESSYE